MKRVGLLGGMSWESSIEYERIVNEEVRRRLGGAHSADLVIRSYDFDTIEALQGRGAWPDLGDLLAKDARALEAAGAELLVICTNTMHVLFEHVSGAVRVPLLHIADATAAAIKADGLESVALLGTRYTMEMPFFRERLATYNIATVVPDEPDRTLVHDVIYRELVRGIVNPASRVEYLRIIRSLLDIGAQGVIAGCTEIELLLSADDIDVPLFPTARLHAIAAVDAALA